MEQQDQSGQNSEPSEYRNDEEEDVESPPVPFPERNREHFGSPRSPRFMRTAEEGLQVVRDGVWSCTVTVLTFWFSVSMALIWGVYGSTSTRIGPNSSMLIKPNPIFVESVMVDELDSGEGPMLYGFYGSPPLDVVTSWSESHKTNLPASTHKDWTFFLNEGSQINISYSVNPLSSSLVLVIAQGNEDLARWIEDPSYPNTTLSWNIIKGNGTIQQDVSKSSTYYIAVGNVKSEVVEVKLNFRMKAFLYNTTEAYYKCTPAHGQCVLNLCFSSGNVALLTSPGRKFGMANSGLYVKLSYGPRWITYLVGIGGMTVLVILMYRFWNHLHCNRHDQSRDQFGAMQSDRDPLLSQKDDDLLSCGSSYDSVSQDGEFHEERLVGGSVEGKQAKDGECSNNMLRLCAICFDSPRNSFFLPCGHCVACFACATRITAAVRICPICRRHVKKVKKIFTV